MLTPWIRKGVAEEEDPAGESSISPSGSDSIAIKYLADYHHAC